MSHLPHRLGARKRPTLNRLTYIGTYGFPRRSRWGRPFTVRVFRLVRIEMGAR
jgi:hypothetical protein